MNPGTLDPLNPLLLSQKVYSRFDDGETSTPLAGCCLALLSEQKESWQKLNDAYDVLKTLRTRNLFLNGFSIRLYFNPGRMTSTTATVGQKDVKDRPCFLCLNNLPAEQRGILYRNEYMILCNPMPVFPSHFTIAHVDHRPQAISGDVDAFLMLMADLGDGWITLYNGPRCGASAPDHLHFQALPAEHMPVENEIKDTTKLSLVAEINDIYVYRVNNQGREIIMLEGNNRVSMAHTFMRVLASLKKVIPTDDEPMVNVAGFFNIVGSEGLSKIGRWQVLIFPRRKHRPDVFYREDDERIVVSPAVVEMAGVLVTPMERDFNRLDAAAAEAIYREVSLDGGILMKAMQGMV